MKSSHSLHASVLSLCRMMLRDNSFVQTFRHEKTLVSTGVSDMDISETLQKRYLNVHLFYTFIRPPTKHWYKWKPMRIMFDRQRLLLSILIYFFTCAINRWSKFFGIGSRVEILDRHYSSAYIRSTVGNTFPVISGFFAPTGEAVGGIQIAGHSGHGVKD